MRLDEITVGDVGRAIDLYLEVAYRGAARPERLPRPQGDPAASIAGRLALDFQDESGKGEGQGRCYSLRLGNCQYPFMKLRLQEMLFKDEFYFTVDTHDQMFQCRDDPRLARVMAFNREVKEAVEASWEGAGLPTTVNLQGLLAERPVAREAAKGLRILVVDDCLPIQETVARMLEQKGYDVDLARDGVDALDQADPDRHALILMDVEMPRKDGFEACRELKADPRRCRIPVLLASAGAVELAAAAGPDGFLVKPFQAEALFTFVNTLLKDSVGSAT